MIEEKVETNMETYENLILASGKGGLHADAKNERRCNPDERTVEEALNVFCSAGLVDQGREHFLEIQSIGGTPSVIEHCMLLSVLSRNNSCLLSPSSSHDLSLFQVAASSRLVVLFRLLIATEKKLPLELHSVHTPFDDSNPCFSRTLARQYQVDLQERVITDYSSSIRAHYDSPIFISNFSKSRIKFTNTNSSSVFSASTSYKLYASLSYASQTLHLLTVPEDLAARSLLFRCLTPNSQAHSSPFMAVSLCAAFLRLSYNH
ncbi:hypothetical protein KSP40_PGU018315 [Platanthera guangdongensis]|uniref:Uncharacterized protein n=1 Tax=Platanthera guangdongensis TaxID=2320717 RepID=A0ABR2MMW7_9ASPA